MPAMHTLRAVVHEHHATWHHDADDQRRLDRARSAAAEDATAEDATAAASDHPDPSARRWSVAFHGIRRRVLMGPSRP